MHNMLLVFFTLLALGSCLPRLRDPFDAPTSFHNKRSSIPPVDPFFSLRDDPGRVFHMDVDGVAAVPPKKFEKVPIHKSKRPVFDEDRPIPDVLHAPRNLEFLQPQPGVPPKLTGAFVPPEQERTPTPGDFEFFNFGEGDGAVINPAAAYLKGGDFEK
ncbi:hypothetical protein OESDEN_21133, partial [Oesophagostomum dentatum]